MGPNSLGAPWLEKCINNIVEDDNFAEHFQKISNTLGYLVKVVNTSSEKYFLAATVALEVQMLVCVSVRHTWCNCTKALKDF